MINLNRQCDCRFDQWILGFPIWKIKEFSLTYFISEILSLWSEFYFTRLNAAQPRQNLNRILNVSFSLFNSIIIIIIEKHLRIIQFCYQTCQKGSFQNSYTFLISIYVYKWFLIHSVLITSSLSIFNAWMYFASCYSFNSRPYCQSRS